MKKMLVLLIVLLAMSAVTEATPKVKDKKHRPKAKAKVETQKRETKPQGEVSKPTFEHKYTFE